MLLYKDRLKTFARGLMMILKCKTRPFCFQLILFDLIGKEYFEDYGSWFVFYKFPTIANNGLFRTLSIFKLLSEQGFSDGLS